MSSGSRALKRDSTYALLRLLEPPRAVTRVLNDKDIREGQIQRFKVRHQHWSFLTQRKIRAGSRLGREAGLFNRMFVVSILLRNLCRRGTDMLWTSQPSLDSFLLWSKRRGIAYLEGLRGEVEENNAVQTVSEQPTANILLGFVGRVLCRRASGYAIINNRPTELHHGAMMDRHDVFCVDIIDKSSSLIRRQCWRRISLVVCISEMSDARNPTRISNR